MKQLIKEIRLYFRERRNLKTFNIITKEFAKGEITEAQYNRILEICLIQ
jgi:uncharacterized membrane protein